MLPRWRRWRSRSTIPIVRMRVPYPQQKERSSVVAESKYDTTRTSRESSLREQFIELIKKARKASLIEKVQIEVALSLVIDQLLVDCAD
jgi:hypothetical protein